MHNQAQVVVHALTATNQTIASCESLTAGLLAATLAEVPGASAVLLGGLITYATELKHTLAGVPSELLAEHGPVSPQTAIAMASGTQQRCGSDWAVALTGVAGPTAQDGHPVGEVWIGIARPDQTTSAVLAAELIPEKSQAGLLHGRRDEIRRNAVSAALALIIAEAA